MKVAVPKEIVPGERRVALIPETVARLTAAGLELLVQSGAGEGAFFADQAYREAGATLVPDARTLYGEADVVLKVQKPVFNEALGTHEVDLLRESALLIGFLQPLTDLELVRRLAARRVTAMSMETVPRITRAQPMDALSSMSTVAGYKAVLLAADTLGKFLPMFVTAAGTIAPSRAFILGAGVAGLQAIATARRLGAVVEAFDVRPAVKEQVESLGASFVEVELEQAEGSGGYAKQMSEEFYRKEQELIHQHVRQADIVITTALVPGKPAPKLVSEEMVRDMRPGSVIVDLAGEQGGNCALSVPGESVVRHGVTIHTPLNLPATLPIHASQMYAKNISTLFLHLVKDKRLNLDFDDEITRGACITHDGAIVNEQVRSLVEGSVA